MFIHQILQQHLCKINFLSYSFATGLCVPLWMNWKNLWIDGPAEAKVVHASQGWARIKDRRRSVKASHILHNWKPQSLELTEWLLPWWQLLPLKIRIYKLLLFLGLCREWLETEERMGGDVQRKARSETTTSWGLLSYCRSSTAQGELSGRPGFENMITVVNNVPSITSNFFLAYIKCALGPVHTQIFLKTKPFLCVLAFRTNKNNISGHWNLSFWETPARVKIF